jgi:hypothetical protein
MAKRKEEEPEQRKRVSWSEALERVEHIPPKNTFSVEEELALVEIAWASPAKMRNVKEEEERPKWICGEKEEPEVEELPVSENKKECVKVPLIDLTTRNYIPRISYEKVLEGDPEISLLLN